MSFKISAYDPNYSMPSVATVNLNLIFSPQCKQITFNTTSVYAGFNPISITLNGCQDTNTPIEYKFHAYLSE